LAVDNGVLRAQVVSAGGELELAPVTSNRRGQLYVSQNGQTRRVSPQGAHLNYLWASVSPDGQRIVYFAIEHNRVYVTNIDGSNPISLGEMRAPVWMGNDWVIGMLDEDDGRFRIGS